MSLWLDKRFVESIRFQLEGFEWEREYVANFRCPLCGDSKKSSKKRRAYFFPDSKEGVLRFKCHNCGEKSGWSFQFWLKDFSPTTYREYQFELFKETGDGHQNARRDTEDAKLVAPKASTTARVLATGPSRRLPEALKTHMTRICDLPHNHYARQYIESRKLPGWVSEFFGYAETYLDLVKGIGIDDQELLRNVPRDSRIIIPLLSESGQLLGVQGRALDPSASLRYATNKLNEDYPKTFGLSFINKKKPILVVEGPIDSTFLPNCVATADSNLLKFQSGSVYIPDNQYRNREICRVMSNIIESGKRVCIFPKNLEQFKDINEMILGGYTQKDLLNIIATNSYQGLKAKLVWSQTPHV